MKKLLFLFLMSPIMGWAQQKYFTYQHNGLYGITDVQGNDVVKATYSGWERSNSIDSLTILENKGGKTLVFIYIMVLKTSMINFSPIMFIYRTSILHLSPIIRKHIYKAKSLDCKFP